ncbi:hypothetical protein CBM2589_A70239 [Cupriavidus taiwanensis]|uniref:Uncharacterized protein n=1 Tax=Cupriavidus taiwanensis TaxID=164546 RepID=A0A975XCZ9_9BURK|nr:hypothetical protein CBM2589_A70239 [Cupriavidus taiwanensis]
MAVATRAMHCPRFFIPATSRARALPGALFCHLPVIFLAATDLVAMPQEMGTVAKAAGACNGQAGRHAPALR